MPDAKAKKGDVVLVHQRHSSFFLGKNTPDSGNTHSYSLGTVRRATREGMVEEVDVFGGGIARRRDSSWVTVYTIPEVSPADAEKVARSHTWPGHDSIMPFDDVADVRDALRPFKKT